MAAARRDEAARGEEPSGLERPQRGGNGAAATTQATIEPLRQITRPPAATPAVSASSARRSPSANA